MTKQLTQAQARGRVYKLLSWGFLYPREPFLGQLFSGEYPAALVNAAQVAWDGCEVPEIQVDQELVGQLPTEYIYYFEVGKNQPPCAPYAGIYLDDQQRTHILLHLSEVYKNFGLEMAAGPNELQDHLAVELEFMHFLCFKESQAMEENAPQLTGYRQAQKDFLQRHLLEWLPAFVTAVKQKCRNDFYLSLADLCQQCITLDSQSI